MSLDPTVTDPDKYHRHPDSFMYTLSSFERRLVHGDRETDVQMPAGRAAWLAAQEHAGENIGTTDTHVLFVELKEPPPAAGSREAELGPSDTA